MPTPSNLGKQEIITVSGLYTITKYIMLKWRNSVRVNSTSGDKGESQPRSLKLPMPLLASVKNPLHLAWQGWWTEEWGWLKSSHTGWNNPLNNSSAFKWQEKKNQHNISTVYYWTSDVMCDVSYSYNQNDTGKVWRWHILTVVIQWSCRAKSEGAHPSHLIAGVSTQTWCWTDLWAHASCEVVTHISTCCDICTTSFAMA